MNDYWDDEEELDEGVEQTQPRRAARRRRADEALGNLYLLTGLIIGLGLGLLIAWVISPVQFVDIDPGALAPSYKVEYRRQIALAYQADRNLERARERAILLDGNNAVQQLAAQAQQMLAENRPAQEARALAVLAADLARPAGEVLAPSLEAAMSATASTQSGTGEAGATGENALTATEPAPSQTAGPSPTATITRTAVPTFTPRPSATQASIFDAPFVLSEQSEICDGSVLPGTLIVQVDDAGGNPLPGIEIKVLWQANESTFVTGLATEQNPGYADFNMQPGFEYSLQVGSAGEPVSNIKIPDCNGGLQFTFQQSGSSE